MKKSSKKIRINLFWKILLWFWLVFILIFSSNLFFIHLNSDQTRYQNLTPQMHQTLKKTKKKLHFILKRQFKSNAKHKFFLKHIYLINSHGEDLFNKPVSQNLYQLHEQVKKNDAPMSIFKKQYLDYGGLNVTYKKQDYHLYVSQRLSVFSRSFFSFFIQKFSHNLMVSAFLVSFPLSFLIAWLFTRPIKRLQLAIKEMSENLSERKNLHLLLNRRDEFGDLARDFEKMATHLNQVLVSKTRLLGDVSHELRSPLARLQIALGLANKKQNDERKVELNRIKLEADRMNQMLTSLLDYSKINNQYNPQKKEPFDLSKIIEVLVNDAKFEGEQKGIKISLSLEDNIIIAGIKPMLISAFENILRNAIRYAKSKVEIVCKLESNDKVDSSDDQNQPQKIIISIVDDGIGVMEDQKEKIFDAFYRPESARSRQSGGVGLGLSIAKKAIDYHSGEIYAENVSPCGLKILILLPAS